MKKHYLLLFAFCALILPQTLSAQCSMDVLQGPGIGCIGGVEANIMPTKEITLYTGDFLLYLDDDEAPVNEIMVAIRRKGDGVGFPVDIDGNPVDRLTFTCSDIGLQPLELWAMNATGNTAFCETSVQINDNMNNCPEVSGRIDACAFSACHPSTGPDFTIRFEVTAPGEPAVEYLTVGPCGHIFAPEEAEVIISMTGDHDPLNGIGSLDIVRLSQFVQGEYQFVSPYQWIAADANNDQVIDSLDVLECRRLLLGIYTELPNNSAWRFVDKNYEFPSPDPLSEPFPESITLNTDNLPSEPVEFVAVKICDVACPGLVGFYDLMPEDRNGIGHPQPNPTRGGSLLPLQLVRSETILLDVQDVSGRVLFSTETRLPAGPTLLEIPASALPQAGMYVWRVRAGDMFQAGKLVRE